MVHFFLGCCCCCGSCFISVRPIVIADVEGSKRERVRETERTKSRSSDPNCHPSSRYLKHAVTTIRAAIRQWYHNFHFILFDGDNLSEWNLSRPTFHYSLWHPILSQLHLPAVALPEFNFHSCYLFRTHSLSFKANICAGRGVVCIFISILRCTFTSYMVRKLVNYDNYNRVNFPVECAEKQKQKTDLNVSELTSKMESGHRKYLFNLSSFDFNTKWIPFYFSSNELSNEIEWKKIEISRWIHWNIVWSINGQMASDKRR